MKKLQELTLVKPAPTIGDSSWFTRDRFGMFIHWGLYALPARHEWIRNRERISNEAYEKYFRHFDPCHEREDETFYKLGYIDIQFLAPRIRAKLMMGTGLMDTTCPPSTQFAMYNKLTCEKSVVIYPDYGHEGLKGHADKIFEFIANNI